MADIELDSVCDCGGKHTATLESAPHDSDLLDIVVSCEDCNKVLNSFVSISEMSEVHVDGS